MYPTEYMVIASDPETGEREVSFYDSDHRAEARRDAKLAEGQLFEVRKIADFERDE